jgi:hypothetical protein
MISPALLWIIVAISAVVYLIGLLLLNKPAGTVILSLSGMAVTVASMVLYAFDRFLWIYLRRLPGVRLIFKHPVLQGTWKGAFHSSYVYSETGEEAAPTEAYLVVRQTYSALHIGFFSSRSSSESLACDLKKKSDGRYEVYTTYESKTPVLSRGTSPIHHGGMILNVIGDSVSALEGWYWTDRETSGEVKFNEHSKMIYDRFEDASKGTYA